jgi:hypothetical protein
MCVKEAFAYQRGRAGIEYKINNLCGEYKLFNTQEAVSIAWILGPDS